jgi:hypothetical protein
MRNSRIIQRRYIFPTEHGSWIWWIGPFCVGLAAAGHRENSLVTLFVAMLSAFLLRQPTTIYIKTFSGRRSKSERIPALLWMGVYGLIALATYLDLLRAGFSQLLWLMLPGIPVFGWHLFLVSQRAERGQRGIEIVGAGVLALAAPASYWVASGASTTLAWTLWAILWLQSAASIVLVYQRLAERQLTTPGNIPERTRRATRAFAYHTFNVVFVLIAQRVVGLPWSLPLASLLMLIDAVDTLRAPAVGWKPARIGLRQLFASSLFMILVSLGFLYNL